MCDFDYDFTYSTQRLMRCRKRRRCCSCGISMLAGEVVERSFGSDGGDPVVDFRCQTCIWMSARDDGSFLHLCDRELMSDGTHGWKHDYVRECLETGAVPSERAAEAIGTVLEAMGVVML